MTSLAADPTAPIHGAVLARVDGVRVVRGTHEALVDVDLVVPAGVLTVLTGPNGAGKSTLVEVLAGVLAPAAGTVATDGGATAFVPQRAAVPERLPVTVREVVAMGTWGETGLWRRTSAAGRARMRGAIDGLGLAALERRPFATLSGGERQRTLLAQGLARGARLLLLDEPTTGLDARSAEQIRAAVVREVSAGVAVVAVSHDPAVIDLAGRVVRLEEGRVVGGTAEPGGPGARLAG